MPLKKLKIKSPALQQAGHTYSEAELTALARDLGRQAKPGSCFLLEGELGAGKSTFARAFFEGAKVTQAAEGSPTFPIAHTYQKEGDGFYIHADLYRLKSMDELEATGLLEFFWSPQNISLIEWPNQIDGFKENILSRHPSSVLIEFEIASDTTKRLCRLS